MADLTGDYHPQHLARLTLEQLQEELAYMERHAALTEEQNAACLRVLREAIAEAERGVA